MMYDSNSGTPNPGRERYPLRSECSNGFCSCNNTPDLPRGLRCRNSRSVDSPDKESSTMSTQSTNSSSISDGYSSFHASTVSSLKNGSPGRHKSYRVHWPTENLICSVKDSNINGISALAEADTDKMRLMNGHATGKSIEMSTTSSLRVFKKVSHTTQKSQFQLGSGDGSYISNQSYSEERFIQPSYRSRYYASASESIDSGSAKGSNSIIYEHIDGNGSVGVANDEDDFLHRKTFRDRYTSDGFQIEEEKTSLQKVFYYPIKILNTVAWCVYTFVVHILVTEKWLLRRSNNSTIRDDSYYYNLRSGYASNGTKEGYSSKFKHFFFKDKNAVSNYSVDDSNEIKRRNVIVYNNSNSSKTNNSYVNSQYNEDHSLSDEETFTSSWNRSRGLCLGCLKIFAALLLLAFLGYLAYLVWSPISSYASATSEFVGSCLSSIITQTVGVLYYIGSLSFIGSGKTSDSIVTIPSIPVTEENVYVQKAKVDPIPTPIPPIISKEELDDIFSRLRSLETKVAGHDNKIVGYEVNYNELNVRITQLESAMQDASTKGKTPDQILQEILHFNLGETSDGKIVTLSNLVTLWNTKTKDGTSDLDAKIRALAEKIAMEATASKLDRDKINEDVHGLKTTQTEIKLKMEDKPVEIDMHKIKDLVLPVLMSEIGSQVKVSCATRDCPEPTFGGGVVGGTQEDLEKLIKMAIAKYDADKTGLPDLALETAGGTILSTRCTKSSKLRNSVVSFFGFKIWSPPNNPRTIIQPGVVPGECWAFEGSVGDIVIQLVAPSIITGFTVEHISKSVSPYGNIDSAPYKFEVWGLNAENDFDTMWNYGTFSYEDNGETLQYFPVQNANAHAYPIIELKILSNHGNMRHTCLYRFRVHGALDMKVMNVKIEPGNSV